MSRAFSFHRRRFRPLSGLERGIIVAAVVSVVVILKPGWVENTLNADLPTLPPIPAGFETEQQADISGHARIVDGDGLEIGGQSIRLHGIDAFEMRQMCGGHACGQASANALRNLVGGRSVDCVEMDRDRYGRIVAVCNAGGQDLGAAMVRQGHAVAYTRYSHRYVLEERAARRDNAGAWAYGFTQPEAWRRAS
jgi:endonuclease YncB( thermonuclease family)